MPTEKKQLRNIQIATLVTSETQQQLKDLADRNMRTVSQELRVALANHLKDSKNYPNHQK